MAWDSEEDFLREMIESGCATNYTLDENGEEIIEWDLEKLKATYPEVYEVILEEHEREINEAVENLLLDGLIEVVPKINDNGEIEEFYSLTPEGKAAAEQLIGELPSSLDNNS